jgi:hypothetical protein
MIQPLPTLKDRLPRQSVGLHMLDRAEQALQDLAGGYITQIGEEISERARVVKTGREPGTDMASALRTVTMAVDGIKGHGRSLGYPFLGEIMGCSTPSCATAANWMPTLARCRPWSRAISRAAAAMSAAN